MLTYKDRSFCNMLECNDDGCDRKLTEEDIDKAKQLGLMIAFSEFWRHCITYEQARKGME